MSFAAPIKNLAFTLRLDVESEIWVKAKWEYSH